MLGKLLGVAVLALLLSPLGGEAASQNGPHPGPQPRRQQRPQPEPKPEPRPQPPRQRRPQPIPRPKPTHAPEFDPRASGAALALLLGGAWLLSERRRRLPEPD